MDAGQHDCWVHDYQLALVPRMLRERGFRGRIGFFLHTPFPRIDLALDYAPGAGRDYLAEFAEGILHADLAGFQTVADQERFEDTLRQLNLRKGPLARHATTAIPVGVDSQPDHEPMDDEAAGLVHESEHLPLVVGLERFDFTKGIPERLRSVARVIHRGARFRYLGIAAPTRQGVQVYEGLRAAVDDAADEARQAAERARLPFLQSQRALSHGAVSTLLREADIIFTSSFADGMNLVPLQGIVAQTGAASHNRGVVIAGRDTGAYRTYEGYAGDGLRGVDPLSWDDMDEALLAAIEGRLPAVTDRLGRAVRDNDARHWAQRFLTELQAAGR
jgi:trehalose-6-phosphate synthase